MRKLIILFIGLFLTCATTIQAQDLLKVDEIMVVNATVNNVIVEIKTGNQGQSILNRVTASEVNRKAGFTPTFNADNALLTLNFTRQFSENELSILLEYSGIELGGKAFNKLYNLINQ